MRTKAAIKIVRILENNSSREVKKSRQVTRKQRIQLTWKLAEK